MGSDFSENEHFLGKVPFRKMGIISKKGSLPQKTFLSFELEKVPLFSTGLPL